MADVDLAIAHYLAGAPTSVAQAFIGAIDETYDHISRFPSSGSPRVGRQLRISELRSWQIKGYPHIAFYIELEDHIDVWHVLHTARDIPPSLTEDMED